MRCPEGQPLPRYRAKHTEEVVVYRAEAVTCNACLVKTACTDAERGRIIQRSVYAAYLETVHGYHATEAYKRAMRKSRDDRLRKSASESMSWCRRRRERGWSARHPGQQCRHLAGDSSAATECGGLASSHRRQPDRAGAVSDTRCPRHGGPGLRSHREHHLDPRPRSGRVSARLCRDQGRVGTSDPQPRRRSASSGILVNAVAPGFISTRLSVMDGVHERDADWFRRIYVENAKLPLRRHSEPDEVAPSVVGLASEQNSYITGQVLGVDGGLSITF